MSMAWADPPPNTPPPTAKVGDNRTDWKAIVQRLRDNPRRWARIQTGVNHASHNATRQRLRRWGGKDVQTASRTCEDGQTFDVYARWIGRP